MSEPQRILRGIKSYFKIPYQYISGLLVEKKLNPVNYNGVILDVNYGSIDTRYKARFCPLYILNAHSINEKELIDRNLSPDTPVIELGGGIGYISCYINQRLDSQHQIVVEPNPSNIKYNKRNRRLNNCNYTLLEGAYHPVGESTTFQFGSRFSTGKTQVGNEGIEVAGFSLDSICQDYELDEFCLVSDIEGGEFPLIDNEMEILSERANMIIMEFHAKNAQEKEIYKRKIQNNGFSVVDESEKAIVFESHT